MIQRASCSDDDGNAGISARGCPASSSEGHATLFSIQTQVAGEHVVLALRIQFDIEEVYPFWLDASLRDEIVLNVLASLLREAMDLFVVDPNFAEQTVFEHLRRNGGRLVGLTYRRGVRQLPVLFQV